MTLLAALASAVAVGLAVGHLTGHAPSFARPTPRRAPQARRQWLLQAGVDLTPRQFWSGSVLVGLATFGLLVAVTATPAVAAVPAIGVALLPRAYFARRRAARMRELQQAWPDGLRDLVASISAGMSLHRAVGSLADAGPPALREAFVRYPTLARMVGTVPALEVIRDELADPTSDRVIEVLILAHERGGALLAEVLRDLAIATTADVRVLAEIETDGLEQRINARAVFVLPWVVLLALTAQDGFFRVFYRSTAGLIVVAIGALLSLAGVAIVSRLGREPVEPRLLDVGGPETPS